MITLDEKINPDLSKVEKEKNDNSTHSLNKVDNNKNNNLN